MVFDTSFRVYYPHSLLFNCSNMKNATPIMNVATVIIIPDTIRRGLRPYESIMNSDNTIPLTKSVPIMIVHM